MMIIGAASKAGSGKQSDLSQIRSVMSIGFALGSTSVSLPHPLPPFGARLTARVCKHEKGSTGVEECNIRQELVCSDGQRPREHQGCGRDRIYVSRSLRYLVQLFLRPPGKTSGGVSGGGGSCGQGPETGRRPTRPLRWLADSGCRRAMKDGIDGSLRTDQRVGGG